MDGSQVLGYLARRDKWYLGGGKAALWAPEFPLFLDQPGFWDHAVYLDYKVGPLFTLAILDENGRHLEPRFVERAWQPDCATQQYIVDGMGLRESRVLSAQDVLSATYLFSNPSEKDRTLHLVVWTAQEEHETYYAGRVHADLTKQTAGDAGLLFERTIVDVEYRKQQIDAAKNAQGETAQIDPNVGLMLRFGLAIGATGTPVSFATVRSQRQPNYPRWQYSPFYELFQQYGKRLPNAHAGPADPLDPGAPWLVYGALHYSLTVPAQGAATFGAFPAIAGSEAEAAANVQAAGERLSAPDESAKNWAAYFDGVPSFECSDPYLQKFYWYRHFGLRLNSVSAANPALGLAHPCIFEGVNFGWFRQHITYSAFCHMREMRWAHDPTLAQGSLLNFIDAQLENGAFLGVIKNIIDGDRSLTSNVAFYHADWGRSVQDLHALHPDPVFLANIYAGLSRYARYFDNQRDSEGSGLYDVINHMETGQEYSSRYFFVDPEADRTKPIRLKGIDATVYMYNLQRALAWMAQQIGQPDGEVWVAAAAKTKAAILTYMWDPDSEFFYDVAPTTMQRSTCKTAVGFYPFLSDIAGPEHLGAFTRHLFNPDEFWTAFPVPSLSVDDPYFSAEGEWKGTRLVCPWNGRTWLMTNSHVIDALCLATQNLPGSGPDFMQKAVDFLRRCITMVFIDGDLERPTSYEYYNPMTGQAPFFRGTDDYMHSWLGDLLLSYVAGLQPQPDGRLLVRPLPCDLDHFTVDRLHWRGHTLRVTWRIEATPDAPTGLTVFIDGVQQGHAPTLTTLDIML